MTRSEDSPYLAWSRGSGSSNDEYTPKDSENLTSRSNYNSCNRPNGMPPSKDSNDPKHSALSLRYDPNDDNLQTRSLKPWHVVSLFRQSFDSTCKGYDPKVEMDHRRVAARVELEGLIVEGRVAIDTGSALPSFKRRLNALDDYFVCFPPLVVLELSDYGRELLTK
jgi:hypothetical protein